MYLKVPLNKIHLTFFLMFPFNLSIQALLQITIKIIKINYHCHQLL